MLLINVHEFDVIFAQSIAFAALKHQVYKIGVVLRLQCENVLILRTSQDLHEGTEVDAEGNIPVASERREGFCFEHHGHEGDVRIIHGLQGDARVIAVKVAILDEILDGVDNLIVCETLLYVHI